MKIATKYKIYFRQGCEEFTSLVSALDAQLEFVDCMDGGYTPHIYAVLDDGSEILLKQ